MSLWKKTMYHLGLGPDNEYDDYDNYDEPDHQPRSSRAPRDPDSQQSRGGRGWEGDAEPAVRTVPQRPSFPSRDFDASSASRRPTQQPSNGRGSNDSGVHIRPNTSDHSPQQPQLRSIQGGAMEPHTVRPRRFDQAQEVADAFKSGTAVIMNLEGTERDVARRLIDFGSGICYALDGTMEKVATGVYLLKPPARAPRYEDYDD
jgi:cell division inhibitor SepF